MIELVDCRVFFLSILESVSKYLNIYFVPSRKTPRVVKTYLWSNSKKISQHYLHFGIESAAATSLEKGENRNTTRFKASDKGDT